MNSSDIRAKRLWELLGERGYKVGVVNLPTEYPPEELNGFMVCGALTPDGESEFTYPPELKEEILAEVPSYRCEIDYARINLKELSRQIMRSIADREKLIRYLLKSKAWDMFFAVFTETDLAQHKFWAGIDEKHPDHPRWKREFGRFVFDVYERLDRAIGEIISALPPGTAVFVISDHGFGPCYQSFSLERWLAEKGYLVLKNSSFRKGFKQFLRQTRLLGKARNLKQYLSHYLSPFNRDFSVRRLREKEESAGQHSLEKIDWKRSRAYFTGDQGIRLNLKGREPGGIVSPGPEAQALTEKIKQELKRLTYSNGQPVFEAVLTGEEAFTGPFVARAPDLIVPINHARAPSRPEKWDFTVFHPTLSGMHAPLGILIVSGPGVREGGSLPAGEIIDVTPTILYYLGVPLTRDMDGKVLTGIFTPRFCRGPKVTKRGSSRKERSGEGIYSRAGEEKTKERLRALGYID